MHGSEHAKGNGAAGAAQSSHHDAHSIGDHGRRIRRDAAALAAEVRSTTADLERYLTEEVRRRPYGTLGVAAGIGYVLGGGLSARMTVVLLGTASRVATALVARAIGNWLVRSGSASVPEQELPTTDAQARRSDHDD